MSFHVIICCHCGFSEERYFAKSTSPYCNKCGNFLTGQKALTSNEYYQQILGKENESVYKEM